MQSFRSQGSGRRVLALVAGLWALMLATLAGCSDPSQPPIADLQAKQEADDRLSVYVANYPLKYFAERIGGDEVRVSLPVPKGVDPAFWRPSTEAIADYQSADLILLNGASYSKWASVKISGPPTHSCWTRTITAKKTTEIKSKTGKYCCSRVSLPMKLGTA